jgi:hypothetical protein
LINSDFKSCVMVEIGALARVRRLCFLNPAHSTLRRGHRMPY